VLGATRTENAHQHFARRALDVADGEEVFRVEELRRLGTDAPDALDAEWREERRLEPRRAPDQAIGLTEIARDLRDELAAGDADARRPPIR
jgi:hypothetical protein